MEAMSRTTDVLGGVLDDLRKKMDKQNDELMERLRDLRPNMSGGGGGGGGGMSNLEERGLRGRMPSMEVSGSSSSGAVPKAKPSSSSSSNFL
jgi:hypothetical protein